ncbi:unnamed protein product [Ambrosiozyma monospora]|uniref:Unnamed protein product n=1 Tax=Ambrosiozyma monospora TaxID=43982 RepID=A0ACB5UB11_AMBMO|nr:unnamed protein product [Ambrosiozyma monospora]
MHEYKITAHSLYAAVSVGLQTDDILSVLNRLSKVPVAESVVNFIRQATVSYGKVKLVLKYNRYFVESPQADILQMLLKDEVIGPLRIKSSETTVTTSDGLVHTKAPEKGDLVIAGTKNKDNKKDADGSKKDEEDNDKEDIEAEFANVIGETGENEDDDDIDTVHSFEISSESVETIKKRCLDIDYPMLEEYDFRNDNRNAQCLVTVVPDLVLLCYRVVLVRLWLVLLLLVR